MKEYALLNRYPDLKELIYIFRYEIQKAQRPANEVILYDQDVMKLLHISKRMRDYLKAGRVIPYSQPQTTSILHSVISTIHS